MKLTFKISWSQIHFPLLCHMLYSCLVFFFFNYLEIYKTWKYNKLPIFFLFLFFNWWEIAVQCCLVFCHTTMQIRHNFIYIPSILSLPRLSSFHSSRALQSMPQLSVHSSLSFALPFFPVLFLFLVLKYILTVFLSWQKFALVGTHDSKMTTSFLQWRNLQPTGGHTCARYELWYSVNMNSDRGMNKHRHEGNISELWLGQQG